MTNKHLNDFHNLKFENGTDCQDDLENSIESPSPKWNAREDAGQDKETAEPIPTLPLQNSQFRKTGETTSNLNSSNRLRAPGEEMIYNIITDEYFQQIKENEKITEILKHKTSPIIRNKNKNMYRKTSNQIRDNGDLRYSDVSNYMTL